MQNLTGYILGISRGHNSGVCLLKDGEIVFALEEERLSRHKHDGAPYAGMLKVLEYTSKVDYIVISHTTTVDQTPTPVDYSSDDIHVALARKLGLIDRKADRFDHPQVIDIGYKHHKTHAACAFYRSGFDEAVAVVVDGAGSGSIGNYGKKEIVIWEVETIIDCSYPSNLKTLYKHLACTEPMGLSLTKQKGLLQDEQGEFDALITDRAGITKVYEAVTEYCGFPAIEAGKTMGLFPYGKPNKNIPPLFTNLNGTSQFTLSDRSVITPTYPNSGFVNDNAIEELRPVEGSDKSQLQNRRDLAYACQKETQEQVLNLIIKASEMSGKKNVVLSGGYGLNCVANYHYLQKLNHLGINLYVEPVSNDSGTAIGAALLTYHEMSNSVKKRNTEMYLGPRYNYTDEQICNIVESYNGSIVDADESEIVNLLRDKKIVSMFQGRSEIGPRALGNRSLLFDPTFEDGKDFVNLVKHREYFRPFAGTVLEEHAHEWFDLRGMKSSPHMMYAVNCQPGVESIVPSIIHVDGTCRIQTVNKEQNLFYYNLIKAFYNQTGVPILFNTSFNLGGEPLVETLEDALWTLDQSDIKYLYLPEYKKLIYVEHNNSRKVDKENTATTMNSAEQMTGRPLSGIPL